jgi:hypothetical protein
MRNALFAAVVLVAVGCGGEDGAGRGDVDLAGDTSATILEVADVPSSGFDERVVAVKVEWFNDGDEPVDMAMSHAVRLQTAGGVEASTVVLPDEMPAPGGTLPAGGELVGWVGFKLPDGDEPANVLLYGELGDPPVVFEL